MEPHCIPFTGIPHTPSLFADLLYRFSRVAAFYEYDPFEPASFSAAAREIQHDPEALQRRAAVAEVLAEQNRFFGGDRKTEENIKRLRSGQALAVVTGQQVGLFGGPAYSVYKALTAIRLAGRLTADGLPAVPVFWLASEDHDFAEVNHCFLLDSGHQWRELRDPSIQPGNTPVGRIVFDPSIEALRDQLVRLWPAEASAEAEDLLAGYAQDATYAQAFGRLFQRLFAGQGLVVLDPLHPALHALSRPVLRRALEEAARLYALVRGRDRELSKGGYDVQVRLRENATLLFLMANGRRLPLRRRGREFVVEERDGRSLAELLDELEAAPERFSGNVLLRPVVQDWLLPTVAYVAGPNEAAYFGQASVLYKELLGRMPVIFPRASLTLVEPKVRRLLEKYGLELTDFFHGEAPVRARLAERHLPAGLQRRLQGGEARLEQMLAETTGELKKLDPTLAGAAATSRRKMLYQFGKLRRQAARAQAERKAIIGRHLEVLIHSLYPERGLQERRLNFLSIVARQGPDVVERLFEQVNFPCRDHQVVLL
ncbi:MAG: bacillithiol biosynthesis cysteine-adding enzyme BshC [Acidobacteria bacterium]|nr:bacillithiol biosynthesis cysteine-adding enzyme BshC [Acidobacteriota bacterium]